MFSRLFILLSFIFLITPILIFAQDPAGADPFAPGPQQPPTPEQQLAQVIQEPGNVQLAQSTDFTIGSVSGTAGPGTVTNTGDTLVFENLETVSGGPDMTGGKDVTINQDDDTYSAGSVGTLNEGQITIYDGINVRFSNGILTADSVGSMDYLGSTSTDIAMLAADGKEFSVQRAAAVQAGCFLVEDVEIAKFRVGKTVTMTTSGDGNIVYGDSTKVAYDGLASDSSITGSVTSCMKPTYQVKNMELQAKVINGTETVNGSGEVEMQVPFGVVCVNLTPVSTYDFEAAKLEDSFGFLAKEAAYKLCIQKSITQKLMANCAQCGLVDLVNNQLTLNGMIEYQRYWHDSALIELSKQRAFNSLGGGKTTINLQTGNILIERNAPDSGTYFSNFLELHEHATGAGTHRFLGIHEDITRTANSWGKQYSSTYSPATTIISDNRLTYQNADCKVRVLPPNYPEINSILNSLNSQRPRFAE